MKICIENLSFNTIIGILPFERENPQEVIINLSFKYKFKTANSFIDYSIIANEIEAIFKKEKFELLEDSIIYIEKYLQKKYPIKKLKIKVSKPNILTNCIVSLKNK
ncbi:MAG: dihydroneopterin aldolase [Halarcobacter sp.]